MKISILHRICSPDLTKILDVFLILYLIVVTFYGKLFIPIHLMFFDRYPLLFPLSIIILYKSLIYIRNIIAQKETKKDAKKLVKKHKEEAQDLPEQQVFNVFPKKHYLTALLILITVFCVKSYITRGITTHEYHVDEDIIINDLLRMMSSQTLDYERYNYPPVFYYTNYALFSIYYNLDLKEEYGDIGNVPHYPLYEFGRQINAVYGALFVTAVFILCYQIFGLMHGLLASFAVFISPLRLNVDSLFRTQPAADFYAIVVFIILISLLREPKTYKFALLGIMTSIAICSFFIRIVIALPVGLFLLLCLIHDRRWTKKLTVFTVSFILISVILLIPALKNLDLFQEKLKLEREYFERYSKYQAVLDRANTYKAITTWTIKDGIGYGIFAVAIVGLIIGLNRKTKWVFYTYSLIAAHYLFMGSYISSFNRYSSFLIPFYILFAFLALETFSIPFIKKKLMKEKTAKFLSGLLIILCLIPFVINFASLMKNTARPHNLDLFLEWRTSNHKTGDPTLILARSIKLKGKGVIVIPEKFLIKPKWDKLSNFISRRYKNIVCTDLKVAEYFKNWRIIKTFDEKAGKGGTFYVLENSVPTNQLRKDTQLIRDKVPKHWKQF